MNIQLKFFIDLSRPLWKFLKYKNKKLNVISLRDFDLEKFNASCTPNNLLPTVRSDSKKLGVAPIASNSLKPVRSDSREQIY